MTIKEYLILGEINTNAPVEFPKPSRVSRRIVPDTLNDLTMGELIQMQGIRTDHDVLFVPCRVLLDMDEREVLKADAVEVLGFIHWTAREMKRINKLFASTSVPPTADEKKAGVEQLGFGMFGLLDYYAQRMGITDHEAVEHVPWVRVYKCLDMDARRIMFQRRLQHLLSNKK